MIFNSFLQLQRGQKFNLSSRVHLEKADAFNKGKPIKMGR